MALAGAAVGLAAGVVVWRWLRAGGYRRDGDEPRVALRQSWAVIPLAMVAGTIAGIGQGWMAIASGVYLLGGVVVSWIDLDVHRIPDQVLAVWGPALAVVLVAAAGWTGDWGMLGRALAASAGLGLLFLVLVVVGSMGVGDLKLALVTGLSVGALGWGAVTTTVFVGFAAAAGAGVLLLLRGATRDTHLPFGPAVVTGAAVAVARVALGL